MHAFIRLVIYTIIIKPPTNICLHISNNLNSNKDTIYPIYQNSEQLKDNFNRKLRNASIFNANYAKAPPELLDPNYGITNYDKKETNNTTERDLVWLAALDRMRNIDLDAEKYANVFSKAFAAGYSAALVEKLSQQRNSNSNINMNTVPSEAPKEKDRKVSKASNMNKPLLPDEFSNDYAPGRNKMQSEAKNKITISSDDLPFNITSDAVGYGAAYASGYALAAADRAARMGNFNHSNVKPWKMNSAAAAGYAAYYAAAIAQTRAVRHPDSSVHVSMLKDSDKIIVEDNQNRRKMNEEIESKESSIRGRKDLVRNNARDIEGSIGNSHIYNEKTGSENTYGEDENLDRTQYQPFNDDKISSNSTRINPRSIVKDPELHMDEKRERNVQIYQPSEDLSLNIQQNPLASKGAIKNISLLFQNETKLDRNKINNDEDITATNLIIEDNNKLSDNNNQYFTLDTDSTSLDHKRYINGNSNTIANETSRLEDIAGLHQFISKRERRKFHEGIKNYHDERNDNTIVRVMDVPVKKKNTKRKRIGKCGKRKRRKKKKKVKSIINCSM